MKQDSASPHPNTACMPFPPARSTKHSSLLGREKKLQIGFQVTPKWHQQTTAPWTLQNAPREKMEDTGAYLTRDPSCPLILSHVDIEGSQGLTLKFAAKQLEPELIGGGCLLEDWVLREKKPQMDNVQANLEDTQTRGWKRGQFWISVQMVSLFTWLHLWNGIDS